MSLEREASMDKTKVVVNETFTVASLADKLLIPVGKLITELMKNGIFATINDKIDFETAQIIIEEMNLDIELILSENTNNVPINVTKKTLSKDAVNRPPVVAVMGHVDHGKTSILDAIRGSNVVKKESGGITQHISAYQVEHSNKLITFLDTPGHEAFTSIRKHGAELTDIAIIVVAADDGVKPQTIEAIHFAKDAKNKIIVAINKIDKEEADVNKVKQELVKQELVPEEWGGDTIVCEVSAKNNTGIDNLLDMILLVADIEELKADINVPASGLVIEAHLEKGKGPVAKLLVQSGILKNNNYILVGKTYGKIKTLKNDLGQDIEFAYPSSPVEISGLKDLPEFGDSFEVYENEKNIKEKINNQEKESINSSNSIVTGGDLIKIINRKNNISELNVIIKADVKGSLISIVDSLKKLDNDEVAIKFVGQGIGNIAENDIYLASSSNAIIYGFNIMTPKSTTLLAKRNNVKIRTYNIIYELIDDIKDELSKLLSPEIKETKVATLIVKGVFKTLKNETICGGEVMNGKIVVPLKARIYREDKLVYEADLVGLKKGESVSKEVVEGEMCGLSLRSNNKMDIHEEDKIEFLKIEELIRKI